MAKIHKSYGSCVGPLDFPMSDDGARLLENKLEKGDITYFRIQKASFEYFIEGERADVSIISDSSIDKDGEVIDPDSLNFDNYQKNPIVAYNHNYEIPPVGKSLWQKNVKGVWKAKTQYTDKPTSHPENESWFPDSIFHMIKAGTMRGKSIGGSVSWREPTQEDATRLGFDLAKAKRISSEADIWEYSVCPLGCNPNTVVELVSKGLKLSKYLINEFPEVEEFLAKQLTENKIPLIKSFTTKEEYLHKRELSKEVLLKKLESKIPEMVADALNRVRGKVC